MTIERARTPTEAILRYINRGRWQVRIRSMSDQNLWGQCVYRDYEVRLDVLHVLTSPDADVLGTIAHELAHVIACNEPDDDWHGEFWRETYKELRQWLLNGTPCDWLGEVPAHIEAWQERRNTM